MYLLLALLTASAGELKIDSRTVLVSTFFPANEESSEMASGVDELLIEYMKGKGKVRAYPLTDMEGIHGTPPDLYIDSCPPDEFSGCTQIVAKASNIPYAVTGLVSSVSTGMRVEVRVIDVNMGTEPLVVQLDIAEGGEDVFAETVSRSLIGVMKGEIGAQKDIRDEVALEGDIFGEEAIGELNNYTQESGGIESIGDRIEVDFERRTLTKADILSMMEEEGSKEWNRLDMKPMEYLKYYNSGVSLPEWKRRAKGRRGTIVVRSTLGTGIGPSGGKYYGRTYQTKTNSIEQVFLWQTMTDQWGLRAQMYTGIGILPGLDIGVVTGSAKGDFLVDYYDVKENAYSKPAPPDSFPSNTRYVGPEIMFTPLVTERAKPVVGLSVPIWFGRKASDFLEGFPPHSLPDIEASNAVLVNAIVGGEVRLSHVIDVYLHAPISILSYTSNNPGTYGEGEGYLLESDFETPDQLNRVGMSLLVGVQFRVPLTKQKTNSLEDYF